MKVTILVEQSASEDGIDRQINICRDDIGYMEDMLNLFSSVLRSSGFTYHNNLVAYSTDGKHLSENW